MEIAATSTFLGLLIILFSCFVAGRNHDLIERARRHPTPTGAALAGTVVVSYARAKGQAFGIDPNFGYFQRHERALCLAVAATFAPAIAMLGGEPMEHPRYYAVVLALGAVAVGTNITAVSRASFVIKRLRTPAIIPGDSPVVSSIVPGP